MQQFNRFVFVNVLCCGFVKREMHFCLSIGLLLKHVAVSLSYSSKIYVDILYSARMYLCLYRFVVVFKFAIAVPRTVYTPRCMPYILWRWLVGSLIFTCKCGLVSLQKLIPVPIISDVCVWFYVVLCVFVSRIIQQIVANAVARVPIYSKRAL